MPTRKRSTKRAKNADDAKNKCGDIHYLSELNRRADLFERQVGFDLVIFDPANQLTHILNPVAAVVWRHISPDRTFRNIVEALQLSFGETNSGKFESDVKQILTDFREKGLLLASGEKPPKVGQKKYALPIPDDEITAFRAEYCQPGVKSFDLKTLEDRFQLSSDTPAPFSDLALVEPF